MVENRLHLYRRRAPDQEDRRKKLADIRRAKRLRARTEAFSASRGIVEDEEQPPPPANTRKQKLEEWKKRRQIAPKAERKPFVFKKITYNDAYLYRPLESSTFRPPKGILPVHSSQPGGQLESRARNQHDGPPQSIGEVLNAFATAMATSKVKKVEDLNRTFDVTPSPEQSVVLPDVYPFNLETSSKIETEPIEGPQEQLAENLPEMLANYFSSAEDNSNKPKAKTKGHASTGLQSSLAQARKQAQADENNEASVGCSLRRSPRLKKD